MVFGSKNTAAFLPLPLQANRQTAGCRFTVLICCGLLGVLFGCCIPISFLPPRLGITTHAQDLWTGKGTPQSKRTRSPRCGITLAAASDRTSKPKSLQWYSALKWRVRAAASATLLAALLSPKAAWARTLHRVASRGQEKQAALFTVGIMVLLFLFAWLNSKKEDSSEDTRIRAEVERLVRLKKEFEESEANETEGTDDDSMAASLRAAQQSMAEKQKEDEEKEGEAGGDGEAGDDGEAGSDGAGGEDSSAGDTGDAKSGDSSKSDDDGEGKDDPKPPKSE